MKEYQEILSLFANKERKTDKLVFRQTPRTIGSFLRGWQMDVLAGHLLGADPRAVLEGVHPKIQEKLGEEIGALRSMKFQLCP